MLSHLRQLLRVLPALDVGSCGVLWLLLVCLALLCDLLYPQLLCLSLACTLFHPGVFCYDAVCWLQEAWGGGGSK